MGDTDMREHELRYKIDAEIHSRPPLSIPTPGRILHFAWLTGFRKKVNPGAAVKKALRLLDKGLSTFESPQIIVETDNLKIKWEQHSEFASFTLVLLNESEDGKKLANRITEILDTHKGKRLIACQLYVIGGIQALPENTIRELVGFNQSAGAIIGGDTGKVWTDFRIDMDGFSKIVLWLDSVVPSRAGRITQRLLEIETYRMMAMLGFPVARKAHGILSEIEGRFSTIIHDVSLQDMELESLKHWFEKLQAVSSEVSRLIDQTEYRLSATHAYSAIVQQRLQDLREESMEGKTRLSVFLERRMGPAMATCESLRRRQDKLLARIDSASAMFQGHMEIAMGLQNNAILKTIKTNAEQQVKLQHTVEGLSVVAISYYLLGIISLLLKGGEKAGLFSGWEILAAILAPPAIAAVWLFLRRLKNKI